MTPLPGSPFRALLLLLFRHCVALSGREDCRDDCELGTYELYKCVFPDRTRTVFVLLPYYWSNVVSTSHPSWDGVGAGF